MNQVIDRVNPPLTKPIENIAVKHVEKRQLDNGIPVYSISAGMQDVIKVEFVFPNTQFNPQKPILLNSANRLLGEGTSKHTASQLADIIESYGAYYETEQTADYCSVILLTLNKHLERTLPLVHEIITDAIFPEHELSIYKQNNKQRLIVENERVNSVARRKFNEIIFGANHPYGFYVNPEHYDELNSEDLKAFHKKNYKGNHCSILISGIVRETSFKAINKVFGGADWMGESNSVKISYNSSPSTERKYYEEKDGAVQSAIRIGKPMFSRTHPDYAGFQVLNTLLGGYFGSRLMKNIREEKGYTYGIGSAMVSLVHGGYFFIASEVGTDVTMLALDEIYKELNQLKREPVGDDELWTVKNYMLGSFLKSIDGPFNLVDRWKSLMFYNLGYDYYEHYINTIKKINATQLMELADKYFDESSFYELIIGRK